MHEQGVIHRDIKGANILTTKEVYTVLGLCSSSQNGKHATKSHGISWEVSFAFVNCVSLFRRSIVLKFCFALIDREMESYAETYATCIDTCTHA